MAKEQINNRYKTEPVSLLVDEPVGSIDEDILNLKPFADVIAGAVLGTKGPFTIGVYADWGEGKTSVLRIAKELVEKNNSDIVTVWFNAWQYGREEHPIIPLVSTIAKAVGDKLKTVDKGRKAVKAGLSKMSTALRAIAYGFSAKGKVSIPGFGELEAGFVAKEMINRYDQLQKGDDPLIEKTLYYNAFEILENIAKEIDKEIETPKIAVFIDDLDRCNPPEAIKLLESIKLVLSQKGFIFTLALDRRILQGFLKYRFKEEFKVGDYETGGKDYLDKIIQLPLPLLPHEKRFKDFISKLLDKNTALNDKSNQPVKEVIDALQDVLSKGARFNPRNLVRFLNNLIVDRLLWKTVDSKEAGTEVMGFCVISRILRDHFKDDRLYEYLWQHQDACDKVRSFVLKEEKRVKAPMLSLKIEKREETYDRPTLVDQIIDKLSQMEFLQEVLKTEQGNGWLANQQMREAVNQFIVEQRKEEEPQQEFQDDEKIFDDEIRKIVNKPHGAINDDDYQGIKELALIDRGLKTLSTSIAKLTNLHTLHLDDNQLTALPEAIAKLTNLQELYFSVNQLTALPEVIAKLTNLHTLDLRGNQLTAVPEAIAKLTNLQMLSLNHNQLTALPEAIAELTNLQKLDLENNQLTALPEAIAELTNLQELYLGGNQLTALPEAIAKLTNLQSLGLGNNQLTALPEEIAELKKLQTLYLMGNQLTALPDAIAKLTNLQALGLGNNQFTALPEVIAELTNLQKLSLVGKKFSKKERDRIKKLLPNRLIYF